MAAHDNDGTRSTTIHASVLHAPHDLRLETQSLAPPAADELRIAVHTTTLCGSDSHYYNHFRNGDILVREPLTLGHESSGTVLAPVPPSQAATFRPGDRVAIEPGVPCGTCSYCHTDATRPTANGHAQNGDVRDAPPLPRRRQTGRYNICPDLRFRSSAKSVPHYQGLLAEQVNHPARYVHRLPENVNMAEGALLEPLGVALHAWRRSGISSHPTIDMSSTSPVSPSSGQRAQNENEVLGTGRDDAGPGLRILVFGAGAIGALCAGVARLKAPEGSRVLIADVDRGRVEFAVDKSFADAGVVVGRGRRQDGGKATVEEGLEVARETAGLIADQVVVDGERFGVADVVFECTGVQGCVQAGIYATAPGGKVMLVGMGQPIQTLRLSAAALREVDLVGVFRYAHTWPESIELVSRKSVGDPDFAALITHTVKGLDNVDEAFRLAGKTVDADGKLVVKVAVET